MSFASDCGKLDSSNIRPPSTSTLKVATLSTDPCSCLRAVSFPHFPLLLSYALPGPSLTMYLQKAGDTTPFRSPHAIRATRTELRVTDGNVSIANVFMLHAGRVSHVHVWPMMEQVSLF
jgi:hypothetical protein